MTADIAAIRTEYMGEPLDIAAAAPDPVTQFDGWFAAARHAEVVDANAMTLATVDANGTPRARVVLLKGVDRRGFVFYTNYQSDKAVECEDTGRVALVFFWQPLARQVRVEGSVSRVPESESDEYFASRPRESQVGAWASPQSQPVSSREELERAFREAETRFPASVPRPPHWGGYVVTPDRMEFWQGRPARLHDRLEYVLEDHGWIVRRLAP